MLFLISFAWLVAGTFAFVLAILTQNWLTFTIVDTGGTIANVQRGVFWVCNLLQSNATYQTTQCVSMIQQSSSTDPNIWIYRK